MKLKQMILASALILLMGATQAQNLAREDDESKPLLGTTGRRDDAENWSSASAHHPQ
ncbi:MAG: hypothetical protein N838_05175 [Thiohalocapsa sp. PB-PSB1]|nr:MAG: hypothetical protein N838_05175 [Thiohalocapsa sp. PB-PSB1]